MGKGKRQYRELSDVTKQKISRKLKIRAKVKPIDRLFRRR